MFSKLKETVITYKKENKFMLNILDIYERKIGILTRVFRYLSKTLSC